MSTPATPVSDAEKPDYGWDAPYATRNLFLGAVGCLLAGLLLPRVVHIGQVNFLPKPMFFWTSALLFVEVLLFVHYVKRGKFLHRDFMLRLHPWQGNEKVLDVGCGRGLLLVGAARRAPVGYATGLDVWSKDDMGGNSAEATAHNLALEKVTDRCRLVSAGAQAMPFEDESFDVIVSNLCLHNLYESRERAKAVAEIARVLRPGGVALLSDYKLTGEYAAQLTSLGLRVTRRWGSFVACFPPMQVVVAHKPA